MRGSVLAERDTRAMDRGRTPMSCVSGVASRGRVENVGSLIWRGKWVRQAEADGGRQRDTHTTPPVPTPRWAPSSSAIGAGERGRVVVRQGSSS